MTKRRDPTAPSEFDKVWNRIIKYKGKVFKTKTGRPFSYKIIDEKIILQHIVMKKKKDVVYAYLPPINKFQASQAYYCTRNGNAPRVTDLSEFVFWPSYLWGILNDERISKGDW